MNVFNVSKDSDSVTFTDVDSKEYPLCDELIKDIKDAATARVALEKELSDAANSYNTADNSLSKKMAKMRLDNANRYKEEMGKSLKTKVPHVEAAHGMGDNFLAALPAAFIEAYLKAKEEVRKRENNTYKVTVPDEQIDKVDELKEIAAAPEKEKQQKLLESGLQFEDMAPAVIKTTGLEKNTNERILVAVTEMNGITRTVPFYDKNSFMEAMQSQSFRDNYLKEGAKVTLIEMDKNAFEVFQKKAYLSNDVVEDLLKMEGSVCLGSDVVRQQNVEQKTLPLASQDEAIKEKWNKVYDPNYHRINPQYIKFGQFRAMGINPADLQDKEIKRLLSGGLSNLHDVIARDSDGSILKAQMKFRLKADEKGINLIKMGVNKKLVIPDTFMGAILTEKDKLDLAKRGRINRALDVVVGGKSMRVIPFVDSDIRTLVALDTKTLKMPKKIGGKELTDKETKSIQEGTPTLVAGMTDRMGQTYTGYVVYNPNLCTFDITKAETVGVAAENRAQVAANNDGVRTPALEKDKSASIKTAQTENDDPKPVMRKPVKMHH